MNNRMQFETMADARAYARKMRGWHPTPVPQKMDDGEGGWYWVVEIRPYGNGQSQYVLTDHTIG